MILSTSSGVDIQPMAIKNRVSVTKDMLAPDNSSTRRARYMSSTFTLR